MFELERGKTSMHLSLNKYFRGLGFDVLFIFLIPFLAITTAYIAWFAPQYFELILLLDLGLLGYHHVIATYTRIASSPISIIENRFLVFILPFIVLGFVVACAYLGSVWLISTIYLHWQWWHYTRQSEGIGKAIRYKTSSSDVFGEKLGRALFYAVPVTSFLYMSSQGHSTFLFMPVYTLPVPELMAVGMLIIVAFALLIWLFLQFKALKKKKVSVQHFSYLVSHHLVYLVAYVFIKDITIGWLAINIWHNAQYILFVWHYNNTKFKQGVEKKYFLISWLSQGRAVRIFAYFGFCLLMTYLFYSAVDLGITYLQTISSLPLIVIAYQAINFHHYVVDSLIWKLRNPALRRNIGLSELRE